MNRYRTVWFALAAAIGLAAYGWSEPQVTKVEATKSGDGAIVRVSGTGLGTPTLTCVQSNRAWIASFNAGLKARARYVSLRTKLVRYVLSTQYQSHPPVVRVLAWCIPGVKPEATRDANGDWIISFGGTPSLAAPPAPIRPKEGAAKPGISHAAPPPRTDTHSGESKIGATTTTTVIEDSARAAVKPAAGRKGAAKRTNPYVSLQFTHTDVVLVLKALALQTGANIVIAPDLTDTGSGGGAAANAGPVPAANVRGSSAGGSHRNITVSLHGVTVDAAMELITSLAGLSYTYSNNAYVVGSPEFLKSFRPSDDLAGRGGQISEIYTFSSGVPKDLEDALAKLVPTVLVSSNPAGSNPTLVFIGPRRDVEKAIELAQRMDIAKNDVTEVYYPKWREATELSAFFTPDTSNKATSGGTTGAAGPAAAAVTGATSSTSGTADAKFFPGVKVMVGSPMAVGFAGARSSSYLVLRGPVDRVGDALKFLDRLDKPLGGPADNADGSTELKEPITRVYPIMAADPKELATAIQGICAGVRAAPGPAGSQKMLILYGRPDNVDTAIATLRELETSNGNVTQIYVAKYADTRDLAAFFTAPDTGGSGGSSGGSGGNGDASKKSALPPLAIPGVLVRPGARSILVAHGLTDTSLTGTDTTSMAGGGTASGGGGSGAGNSGGGSSGGGSNGGQGSGGNDNLYTTQWSRDLIVIGPSDGVLKALGLLAQLDRPQPQVLIECKVMDVNRDDLSKLGVKWDVFSAGSIGITNVSSSGGSGGGSGTAPANNFNFLPKGTQWSVNAVLDFLVTNQKSKLLANPKVFVLDGTHSQIFIGDDIKYVVSSQVTTTGTTIVTGDVLAGIQLDVVPRIAPDGFVTMALHPEVSLVTAWNDVPGGGKLPQVARRYVDTSVRVKDGDTLVIGGLIRQEELETITTVPILSQLPILGNLFKHRSKEKLGSEVVIFLTVKIAK